MAARPGELHLQAVAGGMHVVVSPVTVRADEDGQRGDRPAPEGAPRIFPEDQLEEMLVPGRHEKETRRESLRGDVRTSHGGDDFREGPVIPFDDAAPLRHRMTGERMEKTLLLDVADISQDPGLCPLGVPVQNGDFDVLPFFRNPSRAGWPWCLFARWDPGTAGLSCGKGPSVNRKIVPSILYSEGHLSLLP